MSQECHLLGVDCHTWPFPTRSLAFSISGFPLSWPGAQEGPAASDLESPWMM